MNKNTTTNATATAIELPDWIAFGNLNAVERELAFVKSGLMWYKVAPACAKKWYNGDSDYIAEKTALSALRAYDYNFQKDKAKEYNKSKELFNTVPELNPELEHLHTDSLETTLRVTFGLFARNIGTYQGELMDTIQRELYARGELYRSINPNFNND